jgi:hypothetical protein
MTKIPCVKVVQWEYRMLFGVVKTTWILPPVKVKMPTRAQFRSQARRQIRLGVEK